MVGAYSPHGEDMAPSLSAVETTEEKKHLILGRRDISDCKV
jgi:hypothetical protein